MNTFFRHASTSALPYGYRVTFEWSANAMACEWEPGVPAIHSHRARRHFLRAYQEARNDFLRDVATMLGGNVLVIDTNGDMAAVRPGTLVPNSRQLGEGNHG